MTNWSADPASFKDPAGFVFKLHGLYYRTVHNRYAPRYDHLFQSGLYQHLADKKWLIPHQEADIEDASLPSCYKILLPEQLAFTSYAYEWSFDMLRDAALLTLKINAAAIRHGMILKDATPYNIQFHQGRPVLIDTLSFEMYDESKPWVAYRQFCETFLFPLYLENFLQTGMTKLLSLYPDGISADDTARMLPAKSLLNTGTWLHVQLQRAVKDDKKKGAQSPFTMAKMLRLLEHLRENISALRGNRSDGEGWSNYYEETILSREYLQAKEATFRSLISGCSYQQALDMGANDGHFSWILAESGARVISIDFDTHCINRLYNLIKEKKAKNVLPLVIDLSNPSPASGFNNAERPAFLERVSADLIAALALVHHLSITKFIPFTTLASFFHRIAPVLIIEFVPPGDPRVTQLIGDRIDTFSWYTKENFEEAFLEKFSLEKSIDIAGSTRTLYLMRRK